MIRATTFTVILAMLCCLGWAGSPGAPTAAAGNQASDSPPMLAFDPPTEDELEVLGHEILRNQQNPEPETKKPEVKSAASKSSASSTASPVAKLISTAVEKVAAAAVATESTPIAPAPTATAVAAPPDPSVPPSASTAAVDDTPLTVDVEVPETIDVGHMVIMSIHEKGQPVRERYVTITPEPRTEDTIIENGGLTRKFCGDPGIYKVRIISIGETRGFAECQKTITIRNPYVAAAVAADREQRDMRPRESAKSAMIVDKDNPASAVRELLDAVDSPNKDVEKIQVADQFRRRGSLTEAIRESKVALDTINGDNEAWESFYSGMRKLFDDLRKGGVLVSDDPNQPGAQTAADKEVNALRNVATELEK